MQPNTTTWPRPAIIEPFSGFIDVGSNAPAPTGSPIVWTQAETFQMVGNLFDLLTGIATLKKWQEREQDLARIRKLESDWDGLDSEGPNPAIMENADLFLRILKERSPASPPMRIVLSSDGTVAFEWVKDNYFIQAEIIDPVRVEWMFAAPGKDAKFRIESFEPSSVSGAQERAWQPAPTAIDEPAFAFAR